MNLFTWLFCGRSTTAGASGGSLRGWLLRYAVLGLLLALPVLALVAYQVHASRRQAEASAETEVRNLTRLIESRLRAGFDHAVWLAGDIEQRARPVLLDPAGPARQAPAMNRWLAEQLLRVPAARGLRIYDARGDLLFFSESTPQFTNIADRAYFRRAREAAPDALVYSELFVGRLNQRVSFQIARSIRAPDGRFLGLATALVDVATLHQQLGALKVGTHGTISLRRLEDGSALVHYPGPVVVDNTPHPALADRLALLSGRPEGLLLLDDAQAGVRRLHGYRQVGRHPLYASVGLAEADYLAAWRQHTGVLLGLTAIGLLAVSGIAYRLALARQREETQARALLESEHHFRSLANGGMALIWTSDVTGSCNYFNQTWLDFTGRTLAQERDDGWLEGLHPEDRQRCLDTYTLANRQQAPFSMEYRLRHHSGDYRWVMDMGRPRYGVQGEFLGYIGHCLDITQRKEVELRLAHSEAQLNLALHAARMGAWEFDFDSHRLSWSEQVFEIFGVPRQEVSRRMLLSHLHPEDVHLADEAMRRAIATRSPYCAQYRALLPQGLVWVEDRGAIEFAEDGRPLRVLGIAQNITERKQAEAELLRHRAHLEALVAERTTELVRAKEHAETANRAKSAFLANMSHEIRTPLNAISGMVYLLRGSGVNAEQADKLGRIAHASQHLLEILSAVLDLSKIEADKLMLEHEPLDPGQLLRQTAAMVEDKARAKGLALHVDAGALPAVPLQGDRTRLQQALLNYLANAIKFTASGSVTLSARVEEERTGDVLLHLSVRDTGPGIAPEALARLFSPFEQADNSITRQYGGTGLGLVITRRLAERMGGQAGAQSQPGQGSTFWFTARLDKAASLPPAPQAGPPADPAVQIQQGFAGRRVLLAEDEPVNREVTLALLGLAGLQADTAEDGAQALDRITARPQAYALVLMDVQMPVLDGLEATQRLRAWERRRQAGQAPDGAVAHLPVLAMTANAFAEDRAACLAAGMDDFIAKPVEPEALFATLLRWLRGPGQPPAP